MDAARWRRAERYARWRQRRLRLDHLPFDVLAVVVNFLPHAAVCHLLHALFDAPTPPCTLTQRAQVCCVPREVRPRWIHGAACDSLCRALRAHAEPALFHLRGDATYAAAHLDWSVFSGTPPRALCVYRWASSRAACVDVDEAGVHAAVTGCIFRGNCSASLVVHRYFEWGGATFTHPDPLVRVAHIVFPHFVLSE